MLIIEAPVVLIPIKVPSPDNVPVLPFVYYVNTFVAPVLFICKTLVGVVIPKPILPPPKIRILSVLFVLIIVSVFS